MRLFDGRDFKDTDGIIRQDIKKDRIPAGYVYPAMPVLQDFYIPCGPWIGECDNVFLDKVTIRILEIIDELQRFPIDDNLHGYPWPCIIRAISGSDSIGT
jgi:hypothetical protein